MPSPIVGADARFGKVDVYAGGEVVVWDTDGVPIPEYCGRWEVLAEAIALKMPRGMEVQHHAFTRGSVAEVAQACEDLAGAFARGLEAKTGASIGFAVIVFPKERDPEHGEQMPGAWAANVPAERAMPHVRAILERAEAATGDKPPN